MASLTPIDNSQQAYPHRIEGPEARQEDEIDLRELFSLANKYKFKVLLLAVMVSVLTLVVSLNITPTYRATATLLIESEQTKAISFDDIYGFDSSQKEYYLTQFEILKSKQLAIKVIESLNLSEHPEFQPKPSFIGSSIASIKEAVPFFSSTNQVVMTKEEAKALQLQRLVEQFSARLSIQPVSKTQLVSLSFDAHDPRLAASVVNTLGEVYINHHLDAKMQVTKQAADWLNTRLSSLKTQLVDSEGKLQQYREQENLVDIEGVVGLVGKELEQTSSQLVNARNELNKLTNINQLISEIGASNTQTLQTLDAIIDHDSIKTVKTQLMQAEQKVSELADVYGPKHPKMIAARAQVATLNSAMSDQVSQLVASIAKQLRRADSNVSALEERLTKIRAEYQHITRKESIYRQLKRDVETNRKLYDTFLARSKETEVASDFGAAMARFTDKAFVPNKPIKPKKSLLVTLAFIATTLFGFVVAFVFELLNDTIKSASEVESKLQQRMLGLVPKIKKKVDEHLDKHYYFLEEGRRFAESIRTFRTSFVLTQLDKPAKVTTLTSSIPNEGKTTTSVNMAFAMAQIERVLLIDCDLRKPSVGKRFGQPAYQAGLSHAISGTAKLEDCIIRDKKSGISYMTAGQVVPNPLELLSSNRFQQLLNELGQKYDRIILDTPPVQAVSDALVLSRLSDAVIYVVRADHTRVALIKNGIQRLMGAQANLAGIVLNQVDIENSHSSSGNYGYYDYYEYEEAERA